MPEYDRPESHPGQDTQKDAGFHVESGVFLRILTGVYFLAAYFLRIWQLRRSEQRRG